VDSRPTTAICSLTVLLTRMPRLVIPAWGHLLFRYRPEADVHDLILRR
jgi:hypothetical protein